jgi:hypothetical protein
MGFFLIGVGVLANLVCGIWILVLAFRKGIGWGLACMFIPFVSLYFVITNWDEAKTPFLASVGGVVLAFMGAVMLPDTMPKSDTPAAVQASAASTPQTYEPPRSSYTPPPSYTPPAPAPVTTTVVEEKKHTLEMVYIDRDTRMYYTEKCRKKPANVARVAKSVAVMQGYTPARCSS